MKGSVRYLWEHFISGRFVDPYSLEQRLKEKILKNNIVH